MFKLDLGWLGPETKPTECGSAVVGKALKVDDRAAIKQRQRSEDFGLAGTSPAAYNNK